MRIYLADAKELEQKKYNIKLKIPYQLESYFTSFMINAPFKTNIKKWTIFKNKNKK